MTRVLVVDDHWMVREGLRSAFHHADGIEIVGEAATIQAALNFDGTEQPDGERRATTPDVILLDARLDSQSSLPFVPTLKARFPGTRVLVVSMLPEEPFALRALEAGADGFVSKDASPDDVEEAIRMVASGRVYLSADATRLLADHRVGRDELTPREIEVVREYALGLRSGQIADRLALSPKTVSTHKTNAMRKLGIETNADLIRWATDLLPPPADPASSTGS